MEAIDAEGKIRQVGLHPPNGRGALYNFQEKKEKNKRLCTMRNGGSSTCVCVGKGSVGTYRFDPYEMGSHWNVLSKDMK